MNLLQTFWHQRLGRPFKLATAVDVGHGPIIVLLHGIGQSGSVWQPLVSALAGKPCRVVAFDLLGFGASPKPDWIDYTLDDHAAAVERSIAALGRRQPIILVGHSMGSLIAARVAARHPAWVKQLLLYEMPLYEGLPDKIRYKWRVEAYRRLYQQIIDVAPLSLKRADQITRRLVETVTGQDVSADTWHPFVKSLQHSILEQTTARDIAGLSLPIEVIYGTRDNLVIRGQVQQIFGSGRDNITAHTIRERHQISNRAAAFLANRLAVALDASLTGRGHSRLRDLISNAGPKPDRSGTSKRL